MQSLGGVADKMDVLMEITLEHLKLCADEGHLSREIIIYLDSLNCIVGQLKLVVFQKHA